MSCVTTLALIGCSQADTGMSDIFDCVHTAGKQANFMLPPEHEVATSEVWSSRVYDEWKINILIAFYASFT